LNPTARLLAILALFGVTRAAAFAIPFGGTGYPLGHLVINDVTLYGQWSDLLAAGYFPADDPMWQYPPLAAPLFLLGRLWPRYDIGFMSVALLADIAALVALLVTAQRRGIWGGAWLWAGAAGIVGPVFLTRFDVFPTAAVMLALLVSHRSAISGALIGVATALKVWPLLALAAMRRSQLPAALSAAAAVLLGTTLILLFIYRSQALSFLNGQVERGLQIESVAGAPFVVAHALGAQLNVPFRYGSMELDVPGAGLAGALATGIGVLLLGWLAVLRLRGRLDSVPGPDVAFTAVLVSVVASRVFSPQYSIWLLGLAAVCLATPHTRMRWPAALICAAAVLTQAIYPPLYTELINGEAFASALQVTRVALVVAACVLAIGSIVRRIRISPGQQQRQPV